MATDLHEEEEWIIVPQFSGENLNVWVAEMEEIMARYDVPKIQKVNFSHVYVTRSAREWVWTHIDEICLMDWSEFVEALRAEFDTSSSAEVVDSVAEENGVIDHLPVDIEQRSCKEGQIKSASHEGSIQGIVDKADIVAQDSNINFGRSLVTSPDTTTNRFRRYELLGPCFPDFSWEPGPDLLFSHALSTVKSISSSYIMPYLSEDIPPKHSAKVLPNGDFLIFHASPFSRTLLDVNSSVVNNCSKKNFLYGMIISVSNAMTQWQIAWDISATISQGCWQKKKFFNKGTAYFCCSMTVEIGHKGTVSTIPQTSHSVMQLLIWTKPQRWPPPSLVYVLATPSILSVRPRVQEIILLGLASRKMLLNVSDHIWQFGKTKVLNLVLWKFPYDCIIDIGPVFGDKLSTHTVMRLGFNTMLFKTVGAVQHILLVSYGPRSNTKLVPNIFIAVGRWYCFADSVGLYTKFTSVICFAYSLCGQAIYDFLGWHLISGNELEMVSSNYTWSCTQFPWVIVWKLNSDELEMLNESFGITEENYLIVPRGDKVGAEVAVEAFSSMSISAMVSQRSNILQSFIVSADQRMYSVPSKAIHQPGTSSFTSIHAKLDKVSSNSRKRAAAPNFLTHYFFVTCDSSFVTYNERPHTFRWKPGRMLFYHKKMQGRYRWQLRHGKGLVTDRIGASKTQCVRILWIIWIRLLYTCGCKYRFKLVRILVYVVVSYAESTRCLLVSRTRASFTFKRELQCEQVAYSIVEYFPQRSVYVRARNKEDCEKLGSLQKIAITTALHHKYKIAIDNSYDCLLLNDMGFEYRNDMNGVRFYYKNNFPCLFVAYYGSGFLSFGRVGDFDAAITVRIITCFLPKQDVSVGEMIVYVFDVRGGILRAPLLTIEDNIYELTAQSSHVYEEGSSVSDITTAYTYDIFPGQGIIIFSNWQIVLLEEYEHTLFSWSKSKLAAASYILYFDPGIHIPISVCLTQVLVLVSRLYFFRPVFPEIPTPVSTHDSSYNQFLVELYAWSRHQFLFKVFYEGTSWEAASCHHLLHILLLFYDSTVTDIDQVGLSNSTYSMRAAIFHFRARAVQEMDFAKTLYQPLPCTRIKVTSAGILLIGLLYPLMATGYKCILYAIWIAHGTTSVFFLWCFEWIAIPWGKHIVMRDNLGFIHDSFWDSYNWSNFMYMRVQSWTHTATALETLKLWYSDLKSWPYISYMIGVVRKFYSVPKSARGAFLKCQAVKSFLYWLRLTHVSRGIPSFFFYPETTTLSKDNTAMFFQGFLSFGQQVFPSHTMFTILWIFYPSTINDLLLSVLV